MVIRVSALFLIAVAASAAVADDTAAASHSPSSELGFLEIGRDYVIRFSGDRHVFKTTTAGVTPTTVTSEDGSQRAGTPATWTMTLTVDIFKVVKFGGGSWVLLEHPSSPDDFSKWNGMRRAMAQLTEQRVSELKSSPEGMKRLKKLRAAASREVRTATAWVNLDHAIAIADVPTESLEFKLSVQAIEVKSEK